LLSDSLAAEELEAPVEGPQQAVFLQQLDLLGNDNYLLLQAHRLLNLQTLVVFAVQESTHTNFVVSSKCVLTMDGAVELCREYHNIY
jgi:hypothetical protein